MSAALAATLLAVDPHGLGGIVLRGPAGPERDGWLSLYTSFVGNVPSRRLPPGSGEDRLLGSLDLVATLAVGRPVAAPGLLAEADGGVLLVPSAERLPSRVAAHLAATMDTGEIVVEREGASARAAARFAAVLFDESRGDDEGVSHAMSERVAFIVDLRASGPKTPPPGAADVAAARGRLSAITVPDEALEALCAAGMAFGVASLRAATFALRAARAVAALAGRTAVGAQDAEVAAALVLAPRATRLPPAGADEPPPPTAAPDAIEATAEPAKEPALQAPPRRDDAAAADTDEPAHAGERPLAETVVEATRAAIPLNLLAALASAAGVARGRPGGRSGAARLGETRGRPAGVRRGAPGGGARLALVDTLRAAAPWQPLRRRAVPASSRILVRREDFRVARFKQRSEAVTIVCVDASGSAALHRLAEAKGAVELILADCYVRRDQVALIAFRGAEASVLLPPTRSLARAKRALAGQAGGGGTPLAAGLEAAALLVEAVRRKGQVPLLVMMTDGKANIARDGSPGRAAAAADAAQAAAVLRRNATAALVLDIAPRPSVEAGRLAADMGAAYIALPYADAGAVSRAALAARPSR